MRNALLKIYAKMQLLKEENGQDLIEYALVAALIALAAVVGMNTVATAINGAFSAIGSELSSYAG